MRPTFHAYDSSAVQVELLALTYSNVVLNLFVAKLLGSRRCVGSLRRYFALQRNSDNLRV